MSNERLYQLVKKLDYNQIISGGISSSGVIYGIASKNCKSKQPEEIKALAKTLLKRCKAKSFKDQFSINE